MAKQNVRTRAKKEQALAFMQAGDAASAKPLLEKVCSIDRKDLEALFMLGIANGMLGVHDSAEQAFRQILKFNPRHPDANNNLGLCLDAQNRHEEALPYFETAMQRTPNNAGFVFNHANALESLGRLKEARDGYLKAIELEPNYPDAYCNLGNVLQEEGDYAQAVVAFEKALTLDREFVNQYPQIYLNLGNALMESGRDEAALDSYRQAVTLGQNAGAYLSLGNAYLQKGRRDEAAIALHRSLELNPLSGSAYRNLVQTRRFSERDADVRAMENLYERPNLDVQDKMELAFALGKVYAELRFDTQSFEYYRQGNALKRATLDYSIEQDRALFTAIKQTVTTEFLQQCAGLGRDDATPIFIIGMPRSGTTLTEQILASHSQVHGAGELNELGLLIARACEGHSQVFPQGLLALNKNELSAIAANYLERLHAYAPNAPRITDKMPHNFLYFGLIHALLPGAKIIHCQRNPMDTALSIFKMLFTSGAASHSYAYNLHELGQYYRLYQELMAHWRRLLPGAVYELHYEDLVSDQETQTRRLLEYCELPWEEACLEFHRTERMVRTASLAQVRQPMHTNSVAAWRRYEQELQPFIEALQAENG